MTLNKTAVQSESTAGRYRVSSRVKRAEQKRAGRSIFTRTVSMLVMIATLLTSLPYYTLPAFSEDNSAYITKDGEKISSLVIREDEKATLTAECNDKLELVYKWQITDPQDKERWIDISGASSQTITASVSLVGSMRDDRGNAYIRCKMSCTDREYTTDPLEITVSETVEEPASSIAAENSIRPMMLAQAPMLLAMSAEDGASPESTSTETAALISDFAESDTSSETGTDTKDYRTCSIVINYLFDNNAIAFEPYGATIAYGEPFEAEIESPDILGYDPFRRIGDEYVRADKVLIEIDHVYENITINVIYEPALVQFQVHHHYQNLHDDQYSITADRITIGYALTGSIVPDGLALSETELPGFKSFPYEKLTVAADGSTSIEIRYDRNYYLVDFDMNGGYGTEPVYTKYGQMVGANTPIRHGYVFDGWELVSYGGHTPTSEQTERYKIGAGVTINVPDANLRYRARWITQETTYTMVFWKENTNDNGYTYWGYLDGLGAMSGSYVSAQNLISSVDGITDEQYFTFNEQRSDKNVLVEGDGSTVVNVYYTRNYYKLTIKAKGLCTIPVGHTHTDDCYDLVCVAEHIHTQQCMPEIICNTEEHTEHTDKCLSCTLIEHTHGSAECLCQLDEHTHTKNCWGSYVGNQASKPSYAPSSPEDGYVYRRSTYSTKYIYIKGTWYTYTGQASNKTVVTPSCSYSSEHMHGIACACDIPEHSHTASCYRDVIHTHTDVCYKYSCGMSVHTHTDSCKRLKCGIAERHTHSSTCTKSSSTNTVDVIYKKYEQNIEDIWPITDGNGKIYNSGERWSPSDSSYYSQVLVYISQMPPDDFTLTLNEANYSTYTMQYYLEALPGNIPTDAEVITYNDRQYVLQNTIKANYNYITRAEDFFDIHGYTQYASSHSFSSDGKITISSSDKTVKFYYNRVTDHYLEFNNNGAVIDSATQYGIMYGASIRDYQFIPDYPSNLEPNAYTFGGWYTSKQCFDGTEVDWENDTMPVGDLLLYAKWAPVKHSVNVYLDSTLSTQIGETQLVDHNAFASAPSNEITNGSYLFQGWFYLDSNGTEKAFVFTGIPIKDDMNIYAKWSSRVSVKYKIQYKLKLTGETIADVTEGDAIAGNNQTFSAKAGDQLYEGFREGYYPLTNSHTITMSAEKPIHEFTFEYVFVPSMPYTVRYVNKATGVDLLPPKVVDGNSLSVVTETFVRIDKMMPDAYQKRLVLSANDTDNDGVYDDNVIVFYYSSDEVHAYYKVVHHIQNMNADGYREYRSDEFVGIIGEEHTVEAVSLTGFSFNGALTRINNSLSPTTSTQITSILGEDGLLIELYYDRITYNYTVKYTNASTMQPIIDNKYGSAMFGVQVIEYAPDLSSNGYRLESNNVLGVTISADESRNVIEFLYIENSISIKYEIVGPVGSGTLSQSSENVKAITGIPIGSAPTAAGGYRFVGWFTDIDCTIPVDEEFIDLATKQLKPRKAQGSIWQGDVVYYAMFVARETSLTVINSGWNINDENQSFIYRICGVEGTESEGIALSFLIRGNGSMTIAKLPVGTYTVTQLSDWSWRYETDADKQITLSVNANENVLEFINSRVYDKWLDGSDSENNIFE